MSDPGWLVPEQVVEDALHAGVAEVRAAFTAGTIDTLLARIYRNFTPENRLRVKAWLAKHDIKIVENYPHDEQELPCWAVVIDPEQQTQQYLGDQAGNVELSTGEHVVGSAERWRSTVGILVVAEQTELIKWLYQLAKWIVGTYRAQMAAAGFVYGQNPAGRDLGFDQRLLQAGRFVYRRQLNVTAEYDQVDADAADAAEEMFDLALLTDYRPLFSDAAR